MIPSAFLICALSLSVASFPNESKLRAWKEFREFVNSYEPDLQIYVTAGQPPLKEHGWFALPFVMDGFKVYGRKRRQSA